jgi:hypothetical protein
MGFFQNLFGNDSANRSLNNASNDLKSAFNYGETAYKPFTAASEAQTRLLDLGGYNGAPAQTAAGQQFTQDPGYQFKLKSGIDALDASASSRGMLRSGAQEKALVDYGQGVADQSYGDWYARQAALADTGAQAVQGVVNNKLSTAGAVAANTAQAGANKSGAVQGVAGLVAGGLNSILGKRT